MTTCSRSGCTKKLNKNNTTGECGSGCLSLEAPPAKRAKGAGAAPKARANEVDATVGTALSRFRLVAEALGKDPDDELEEFAQGWLEALAQKLNEA